MKGQLCSFSIAHACLAPWLMMSAILSLIYLLQAFMCCSEPNVKFMCRRTHTIKRFHIENDFSLISKWVPKDLIARDAVSQSALTLSSHYGFIGSPRQSYNIAVKRHSRYCKKTVTTSCYLGNFFSSFGHFRKRGKEAGVLKKPCILEAHPAKTYLSEEGKRL